MTGICINRRRALQGAGLAVLFGSLPRLAHASAPFQGEKCLSLYNRHTGQRAEAVFFNEGGVVEAGAGELDAIMGDHRAKQVAPMDRNLYHLLHRLTDTLDYRGDIHLISGYRSPATNAMLAARSNGVAKKSYHMKAMASDIALPGVAIAEVRKAALSLQLGGVGYYPSSGFVHVDTGPVRRW